MTSLNETVTQEELHRYAELQQNALQFARNGNTETLARMIEAGLPIELKDSKGNTLLMLACYNQQATTSRMLLEKGADPDSRNDRGQTPLGGVAFKGYCNIIELLLKHGANVNADNGGGKTPMLYATMFGRFKARKLLKKHGGKLWSKPAYSEASTLAESP